MLTRYTQNDTTKPKRTIRYKYICIYSYIQEISIYIGLALQVHGQSQETMTNYLIEHGNK